MAHSDTVEPVEHAPYIDGSVSRAVAADAQDSNDRKGNLAYGIISSYLQARSDGYSSFEANHKRLLHKTSNASTTPNLHLFDSLSILRCMRDAFIAAEHHWRYKKYCAVEAKETGNATKNLIIIMRKFDQWINVLGALGLKDNFINKLVQNERFNLSYYNHSYYASTYGQFPAPPPQYNPRLPSSITSISSSIRHLHLSINAATPDQDYASSCAWLSEMYAWTRNLNNVLQSDFPHLKSLRVTVDDEETLYCNLYYFSVPSRRLSAEEYLGYLYDLTVAIGKVDKKIVKETRFVGARIPPALHGSSMTAPFSPSYTVLRRKFVCPEETEGRWVAINENYWSKQIRNALFVAIGLQPQADARIMTSY
ncbi:hypothetical protein LTR86_009644 [Recurvomyces mirabilis]|nr:hypothetical protein LTR86_009644 [Recurvomyces mirabilis]